MLLLAAVPLAGCGGAKSRACEPCTNADDCEIGLFCQLFRDDNGNVLNLCAEATLNMVCPAR